MPPFSHNLRGAIVMVLAMLGFAVEDAMIKLLAGALPVGQIVGLLGVGGAVVFAILCHSRDQHLWDRGFLEPAILLRNGSELIGTLGFVTAIALIPLSTASAILQAAPLLVTLGAAVFLGEPVGWRRWAAILVGFSGVMLIIRPGTNGFDWLSLFAVQGVVGLAIRDLATRRVAATVSSLQLSFMAFLMLIPASAIFLTVEGVAPVAMTITQTGLIGAAVLIGALAYYGITYAMRVGEISFVTPFRYARMIFALLIGMALFGEAPDRLTLIGAAIIIASGLYTLWREQIVKSTPPA
ncbi:DMT family transporter [uncultured Tateyamaria sp.]|uniref:DMT family transporter n=1 Tax=uncultured Tateyamaria sp. TaxID=455651 RepID=UPI002613E79B|nr:DMT family transporter [uncultured Tateyamaria sp.]